jgi:deazaflavin-dependent oxidoreductase (nitroreductase family)
VLSASIAAWTEHAETAFFRTLNAFMEPLIMAGYAAPVFWPTGMIVLETTGARSGLPSRAPLLGTIVDGCVFVSTLRGSRCQWVRNLRARPEVRYWLGGREHRGRARLFAPGARLPASDGFPPLARIAADALLPPARLFGWTFAVIGPA